MAVDYRSAGTFEGLLQDDEWFFMEMNTRVQVEHCVTELVTGVDIVREQILVAAGEPLSLAQEDVRFSGHAIECRINAEDASKNFAPAPGTITSYKEPAGPGVRMDSGVEAGTEITPLYDPMVAKLIVWDVDREHATRRAIRALEELEVGGVRTLIPFHKAILDTQQWANAETCRDLIEDKSWLKTLAEQQPSAVAEDEGEKVERKYAVEVSGKLFEVKVIGEAPVGAPAVANGAAAAGPKPKRRERSGAGGGVSADGKLVSPLQGTVLKVNVEQGAQVEAGALICVIEAMKMENEITAPAGGTIEELGVAEGAAISTGDTIAVIK
jgi:acetyl-CoA/propionyl-CoA carboxylase biotin carboxyl carrier protein